MKRYPWNKLSPVAPKVSRYIQFRTLVWHLGTCSTLLLHFFVQITYLIYLFTFPFVQKTMLYWEKMSNTNLCNTMIGLLCFNIRSKYVELFYRQSNNQDPFLLQSNKNMWKFSIYVIIVCHYIIRSMWIKFWSART